jgi:hypothetical protein
MKDLTKRKPYRNKAILKAADGGICTLCGIEDGTIVFAHFNYGWAGKGIGQKADDCAGMFLCATCHRHFDSGWTYSPLDILRAYYTTIRRLLDKGVLQ